MLHSFISHKELIIHKLINYLLVAHFGGKYFRILTLLFCLLCANNSVIELPINFLLDKLDVQLMRRDHCGENTIILKHITYRFITNLRVPYIY